MRSSIPLTAQCSRCGDDLTVDVFTRGGDMVVEVEPCEGCLEKAVARGVQAAAFADLHALVAAEEVPL